MKRPIKKIDWFIIFALIAAFLLRLVLAVYGNHFDLIVNAGWGRCLHENGPENFYTNNIWIYGWPTQLPLVNLINGYYYNIYTEIIWYLTYIGETFTKFNIPQFITLPWLNAVKWFGWTNFSDTPFLNGILYSMKLIPAISDIGIALIFYFIGKKISGRKVSIFTTLIFLIMPFTWYTSALWGQYDQLAVLLLLCAFTLIVFFEKWPALSIIPFIFLFAAMETKPTAIVTLPLFLAIVLNQKQKILKIILGIVTAIILFVATTIPFSRGKVFSYFITEILPVVLNPDRLGLANRTFNFWTFLAPNSGWADSFTFLGIKAMYWGIVFFCLFAYLSVKNYLASKDLKGVLTGIFVSGGGFYIFGTGMVDRYFFLGIVSLGLLTFYYPRLKVPWILSSLVFSFNLFYSWGYPFIFEKTVWGIPLLIQIMSFIQTMIFVITCIKLQEAGSAKKPLLSHNL